MAPSRLRAADVGGRYFPYATAPRWAVRVLKLQGLDERDGVAVTDDRLVATFGKLVLDAGRDVVRGAHLTGPYRWYTSVGIRMSFTDDGLTFGTTPSGGVCVHFEPSVPKVAGFRPSHSALTVSVADRDGLVALLGMDEPRG